MKHNSSGMRPWVSLTVAIVCGCADVTTEPGDDEAVAAEQTVVATNQTKPLRCGTQVSDATRAALSAIPPSGRDHGHDVQGDTVVDLWFHSITTDAGKGGSTTAQREEQLRVLNRAYSGRGFQFSLAGTTKTKNTTWYTMTKDSAARREAATALRKGTAATLNVYLVEAAGTLGWATLPARYAIDPVVDGAYVAARSLPNGGGAPFNLGDTLVHEVGHWLGLMHTFDGGCSAFGDGISDTPAEETAAEGCPTNRNTCPASGLDPIHNYMDYTDDACMTEFTSGQVTRMIDAWSYYRAGQ